MISVAEVHGCYICTEAKLTVQQAVAAFVILDGEDERSCMPRTTYLCNDHLLETIRQLAVPA